MTARRITRFVGLIVGIGVVVVLALENSGTGGGPRHRGWHPRADLPLQRGLFIDRQQDASHAPVGA